MTAEYTPNRNFGLAFVIQNQSDKPVTIAGLSSRDESEKRFARRVGVSASAYVPLDCDVQPLPCDRSWPRPAFAVAEKYCTPTGVMAFAPVQKYSQYFGYGAQFWCADFVAFCMDKTGNRDHKVPWGYPSACKNIAAWGQKAGKLHGQPRKGDIFVQITKDAHGNTNCVHTGFVTSVDGSKFMTIEGNTSGPEGDVYVAPHARDASGGMYSFVGPWS